jgi:uncharacterized membrane protein
MDLELFFSGIQESHESPWSKTSPWLEITGGSALAVYGASRRTAAGAVMALLGGYLVYRGIVTTRARVRARPIFVERSFTIPKPAAELYSFWRNFENLPRFTRNLKSVKVTGLRHSHWEAFAPMGLSLSWDTEIAEDRENEFIEWRSLPGAMIRNSGSVQFQPLESGQATRVSIAIAYELPPGKLGMAFARMLGRNPESQVEEDMRRFERLMTMEEIPATDGATAGRRTPWVRMVEAAKPERPDVDDLGA